MCVYINTMTGVRKAKPISVFAMLILLVSNTYFKCGQQDRLVATSLYTLLSDLADNEICKEIYHGHTETGKQKACHVFVVLCPDNSSGCDLCCFA